MSLSAKEAAALVGMSKAGIIKAIQRGDLSASKDRNGAWQIEPVELFRVYPPVSPEVDTELTLVDSAGDTPSTSETALLRELLAAKDDVIADLRRRLDAEADERRRLTALLTVKDDPQPRPVGGFWARLFGRK